ASSSATASPRCSSAWAAWNGSTTHAVQARPASSKDCVTTVAFTPERKDTTMASEFIVLSHREPYETVELPDGDTVLRRKTNGVFTTLDAVMRQKRGTWIAWREQEEGADFERRIQVPAPGHDD